MVVMFAFLIESLKAQNYCCIPVVWLLDQSWNSESVFGGLGRRKHKDTMPIPYKSSKRSFSDIISRLDVDLGQTQFDFFFPVERALLWVEERWCRSVWLRCDSAQVASHGLKSQRELDMRDFISRAFFFKNHLKKAQEGNVQPTMYKNASRHCCFPHAPGSLRASEIKDFYTNMENIHALN